MTKEVEYPKVLLLVILIFFSLNSKKSVNATPSSSDDSVLQIHANELNFITQARSRKKSKKTPKLSPDEINEICQDSPSDSHCVKVIPKRNGDSNKFPDVDNKPAESREGRKTKPSKIPATDSPKNTKPNDVPQEELTPEAMEILCENFPLNSRCAGEGVPASEDIEGGAEEPIEGFEGGAEEPIEGTEEPIEGFEGGAEEPIEGFEGRRNRKVLPGDPTTPPP